MCKVVVVLLVNVTKVECNGEQIVSETPTSAEGRALT